MMQQNHNDTAEGVLSHGAVSADIQPDSGQGMIPSVSVDRILAHRQAGMTALENAMQLLSEAKAQFSAAGCSHAGGMSFPRLMENALYHCGDKSRWQKIILRDVDREIWQKLMHDSGMLTLMNTDQIDAWNKSLYSDDMPEATLENVLASFRQLHASSASMFEQGIVSLFEKLSWDYKTNNVRKFGKKIIINTLVDVTRWGVSAHQRGITHLDDLNKAFCWLDNKPVPDFRDGAGCRFRDFVHTHQLNGEDFTSAYFSLRYFKKGSGHITFQRMDLVEKMNDILASHYPDALPPA